MAVLVLIGAAPAAAGEPPAFLGVGEMRGALYRHTTRPGERSWSRIAANFGVRYDRLLSANKVRDPRRQRPGRQVLIDTVRMILRSPHEGVVINQAENRLYVFRQGYPVLSFAVALGQPSMRTPLGHFHVIEKKANPTWLVPVGIQKELGQKFATMPPGPNNPLGNYWIGLGKGYGIHGTNAPWSIGRYATHGCVRLHTSKAKIVFNAVTEQDTVRSIYQPVKLGIRNKEIYLQVLPPVPGFAEANRSLIRKLVAGAGLTSAVDWPRVDRVLRARDGWLYDVSRLPRPILGDPPLQSAKPARKTRPAPR